MERDEAAKSGLLIRNLAEYNMKDLLAEVEGDRAAASAIRYQKILAEMGIHRGRIALYGQVDLGPAYAVFQALQQRLPGLELVGEIENPTLGLARATKDTDEVARMRRMGQITTAVVGEVADFLTSHTVKGEFLVKADGQPLTIGDVKAKINLWLAERGAENPHGTIFAIGRDAGVPHSSGTASDLLELGKTIVFDIFPCEAGGGYHYDFTRTWCLGYAPDEALALYEDVYAVYQTVMAELRVDTPYKHYQERTCELFEAQGHATIRQDATLQEGYVHSVGHGLGLDVHEPPWSGALASDETDRLVRGVVMTIEPGLYYPGRGLGCRLEDTVYVRPDGQFEVLAPYSLELVLPMKR
jgi:Xaa-Pro aminopeptidase